jgi:hypothetical protein
MMRNNGITGWAAVNQGLRGQESPSEGRGLGGETSTEPGSGWWFGGEDQDGRARLTPVIDTDFAPRVGGTRSNA